MATNSVTRTLAKVSRQTGMASAVLLASALPGAANEDNQMAFNNHCRTCHSAKPDDNRLGPSLNNIVGAKAGAVEGFGGYSPSLKNSNLTWDEATLDQFIANPEQVVSGNNMKPYNGIADAGERKKIIEYLKTAQD